jgi:CDP-diacylglycerol pyrophosphatase
MTVKRALSIVTFWMLFAAAPAFADDTAQCNRTASLGAAVDQCPEHVNPCCLERVDSGTNRYQIMRDSDPAKPVSVLIVALTELDGATSAEYSMPPVSAFWIEGWKAAERHLPPSSPSAPPIALVMNAGPTRGERRIHLHVSCASAKLLAAMRDHAFSADAWTSIALPGIAALGVPDRTFRVRITPALVDDPNPATPRHNPFSMVVADVATPDLQNHAMAIVRRADESGWYVLDTTMTPTSPKLAGYVEDALDETCGGRTLRL